jgi:hypothetical protein
MKIFTLFAMAFFGFVPFASAAEEAKTASDALRVMVTFTTVEAVELTQEKDGSFKVTNMKTENVPSIIKDPKIQLDDDKLKQKVQDALKSHSLKEGDKVTLGIGSTLGGLVGGAANIASPVVSVVGAVVPHIEQIAGLVAGVAKFF